MQLYLISALVFSILVALFAVQNTEEVVVKFITFQFRIPLVLVILGSAAVGALALYFLSLLKQFDFWLKVRHLNSRKKELERQVKELEKKADFVGAEADKPSEKKEEEIS